MDVSFKIDSKSLKKILLETEEVIKSKIDLIDKESFKNFSLFTPIIENQIDSQIVKNEQAALILDSLIIKDQTIIKLFFGMFPPNIKI